jgi:hypothetical protein
MDFIVMQELLKAQGNKSQRGRDPGKKKPHEINVKQNANGKYFMQYLISYHTIRVQKPSFCIWCCEILFKKFPKD